MCIMGVCTSLFIRSCSIIGQCATPPLPRSKEESLSKRLATDPCRVEGCDRPLRLITTRHGGRAFIGYDYWCAMHRSRWTNRRTLNPPAKRKMDANIISPYRFLHQRGVRITEHQAVWVKAYGPVPAGHHIHHLDGNGLNNALDNLQAMPAAEHNRMPHGAAR